MNRTLPYSAFVDPDILDAERSTLFANSWQYVANTADFASGLRSLPIVANGLPIVLTRAATGEVQALVNVCAHRGSLVCKVPSSRESLTCPYHAWRYDLDGNLLSAPRSNREPDFDPSGLSLEPLPTGQWGPFLFVGLSQDVLPFDEFLGDLPTEVKAGGVDVESLVFHHRSQSMLEANWKIVTENFLECYHCRVAHPDFARTIDTSPDEYLLAPAKTYSSQYGPPRDGASRALDLVGEITRAQFHVLYPNTAINIMAGRPNLSIGPINPVTATRTRRFLDFFFAPGVPEAWITAMVEFDDQVGREDVTLVEDMQIGLAARRERRGTLFMDSEQLIYHFETHLKGHLDYPTS